jgi:aconitate hydratase A / 2-methylisocitrate dehydratase
MTATAAGRKRRDAFGARATFDTGSGTACLYRLDRLENTGIGGVSRLPFSMRVMLEAALRTLDGFEVTEDDVKALATWNAKRPAPVEVPFKPARVVLQDFTGVPCVVDLAAMRAAVKRLGGSPSKINPLCPVDLVIDHSVQVDAFASALAVARNAQLEFERNRERYEFLRWGQQAFANFRVVPPATGIVHQVNLEFLAKVVFLRDDPAESGAKVAVPDTLVGTDSHTTMINGLGVVGWGVGGIEAEAVMLGQAINMLLPQVVGFKLTGQLREGVTATDLVLTVTQMLRQKGVVDKFVEFYGPGVSQMTLADRATIANMAPEYGATMGFFPVDHETLRYLRQTGRADDEVRLVERYTKEQGLFRTDDAPDPEFTETLELDLGDVEPSIAGPHRPQDRVPLREAKRTFRRALLSMLEAETADIPKERVSQWLDEGGSAQTPTEELRYPPSLGKLTQEVPVTHSGITFHLMHGVVGISAITSCTNTSNPAVMLGAGILAKKAVERGLDVKPWVKTSLAPGSKVVAEYLKESGLMPYLEALGFHLVAYGCTTCIGNSGPLPPHIAEPIRKADLVVAAVLSGNRNFEGRINPLVRMNFLASPPLCVAYALAGEMDVDLLTEPIGHYRGGEPVYLRDIWPTREEIGEAMDRAIRPEMFRRSYANVWSGNPVWNAIPVAGGELYQWNPASTYVQEPPFFVDLSLEPPPLQDIRGARVLAWLGDSVTTDHISPAGDIPEDTPAGRYLVEHGAKKADFNSYGARRGNDRVMVRGTFANIRLKNLLVPGVEGGYTVHLPSGERTTIYEAAMRYKQEGTPLVVLAGKEYGTGSSRDWAAKGTLLLGVRAVIAESFERIHRSNLIGMGVLPLVFPEGKTAKALGLTGREGYEITGIAQGLAPKKPVSVRARRDDGSVVEFQATARLDTPVEVDYYRNGGILQTVLRQLMRS